MLLHHEPPAAFRRVAAPARLRSPLEVTLVPVALQAVGHRLLDSGPLGIVHGRMDANPIVLDETADDVVVVVVEGEHDIYTAPTLRERLGGAPLRGGGLVFGPTPAPFVDSSGVRAPRDARRRAIEAGQGYVVCVGDTVEPGVQRILDITGLVPVLPVLRGREEAIEAARSPNGTGT